MNIQSVMTKNPEIISPDANIKEAAEKMRKCDCGCIPVCNGDRLVGMITDRDIAIRAVAEGKDPNQTHVDEIMTEELHYCYEDEDVSEAKKIMTEHQIRRLVVLNKKKRMTGIVSLGDLATKCDNEKLVADLTESVSESHSQG